MKEITTFAHHVYYEMEPITGQWAIWDNGRCLRNVDDNQVGDEDLLLKTFNDSIALNFINKKSPVRNEWIPRLLMAAGILLMAFCLIYFIVKHICI